MHRLIKLPLQRLLIITLLCLLAACGFKLRGQISTLPFATLYVSAPVGHTIGPDLKRAIKTRTTTKLAENIEEAEAVLQVLGAFNEKNILALSGGGRVREFQLVFRVRTRLVDNQGNEIVPTNDISLLRILPFLDSQILAKEGEEKTLYKDMQADAVQQIIWRLSSIKKPE